MKHALVALIVAGSFLCGSFVFADVHDAQWVAACIADNQDAKVPVEVIARYCTCMTGKMEKRETKSVTEWEKTHPKERAECDREAGWK